MTIPTQRLPETTAQWTAKLPKHAATPVLSVWRRLTELEQAGHDAGVIAALRAMLLRHQPPHYGRCPACPRYLGRRPRFPCTVWHRTHIELFGMLTNPKMAERVTT